MYQAILLCFGYVGTIVWQQWVKVSVVLLMFYDQVWCRKFAVCWQSRKTGCFFFRFGHVVKFVKKVCCLLTRYAWEPRTFLLWYFYFCKIERFMSVEEITRFERRLFTKSPVRLWFLAEKKIFPLNTIEPSSRRIVPHVVFSSQPKHTSNGWMQPVSPSQSAQ